MHTPRALFPVRGISTDIVWAVGEGKLWLTTLNVIGVLLYCMASLDVYK